MYNVEMLKPRLQLVEYIVDENTSVWFWEYPDETKASPTLTTLVEAMNWLEFDYKQVRR